MGLRSGGGSNRSFGVHKLAALNQLAANELKTITCARVYQALLSLLSSFTLLLE